MCTGVSKSGSPAPSPITSLPSALRRAARAVTASVGEGLTRWTRRETGRVTGLPVIALIRAARLYYGITPPLTNLALPLETPLMEHTPFKLEAGFEPAGDQPQAIEKLVEGVNDGLAHQTLLGVTGSGKTFSIA